MPLDVAASIVSVGVAVSSLLFQVSLWQRKEYRADRMRSYILSPENSLYHEYSLLVSWVLLGVAWFFFFVHGEAFAEPIAWATLLGMLVHHGIRIKKYGVYRPSWTLKSFALLVASLLVFIGYIKYIIVPVIMPGLQAATLLFFLPALTSLAVAIVNIPFGLRKTYIARRATRKRHSLPNVQVVGITGSYGKTSTKYFLTQILSLAGKRYIATPKHCNSYYAVAQHFIQSMSKDSQLYIAEMGAYRAGEIKQLSNIVKPTIGVITAVSNQHISLFGSPEKLLDAKWELALSLPNNGTLIINDDDQRLRQRAETLTGKSIVKYSTSHAAEVWLEHTTVQSRSVSGTIHIGAFSAPVVIPVLSAGLAQCAMAAAAIAHALGLKPALIAQLLEKLSPMPRTMAGYEGTHGAYIIDDSYSGGEHAALNAIHHLALWKQPDKRIAFVPIIELGSHAPAAHEAIGRAMAQVQALPFIYGTAYQADIARGLGSAASKARWFTDVEAFNQAVIANVSPETVILIEGRLPASLRRELHP